MAVPLSILVDGDGEFQLLYDGAIHAEAAAGRMADELTRALRALRIEHLSDAS